MKRTISICLSGIGILLITALTVPGERYFEIAKSLDIFTSLYKEVNANYVDQVDPNRLITTGINSMLNSLDPYTDYIPEEDLESYNIMFTGQYAGIGALIGTVNKKPVVTHPYPGFPAHRAGLKVGDQLMVIDGLSTEGKTTSEVSAMLKGQPQTQIELVVKRAGQDQLLKFTMQRETIKVSNVVYHGMVDKETGYIKLDDFTTGAGREVRQALESLKKQGARSVILDLRDNPGGILQEAVNIVNLFIPKGKEVVATKGKVQDWNKSYYTLNVPIDTDIPMAVLTSGGSASAAEIVAGALQDYDRAVLVGQRTFGKGLVQTTRQLGSFNAHLKVTTARYYIPSGRCIQALDYSHRKSDGTVERFADSVRSAFKTIRGRTVYDGGGLEPDIKVGQQEVGSLLEQLFESGLVFEYASLYVATHSFPTTLSSWHLSDQDYQSFIDWTRTQSFVYTSEIEAEAKKLEEAIEQEGYRSELEHSLTLVKSKIAQDRSTEFERFKSQIVLGLEEEIAFHHSLNAGQVEVSSGRDPEILAARKILADQDAYRKLLAVH